jgi:hypothetical protein
MPSNMNVQLQQIDGGEFPVAAVRKATELAASRDYRSMSEFIRNAMIVQLRADGLLAPEASGDEKRHRQEERAAARIGT